MYRYSRSDGTLLGDRHGDELYGHNSDEIPDSVDSRKEQDVVMGYLQEAMTVLFARMRSDRNTDREREIFDQCEYGTRAYKALTGISEMERYIGFSGYYHEGILERLYSKLVSLYAYVMEVRCEASEAGKSVDELFGYAPLIRQCIELCHEVVVIVAAEGIQNPCGYEYDSDECRNP
jgi:hypothetical protein